MAAIQYVDFELQIESKDEGYLATVIKSPCGEASHQFTLPFTEDQLENLVLKLSRPRQGRRLTSNPTIVIGPAIEFGTKMFEAVFGGEVRACFRSSLDVVKSRENVGLRLKLRFQDAPELIDLPWEYLRDSASGRFLAQSTRTPIVRYFELTQSQQPLAIALPLRILVMISSPTDFEQLDTARERKLLMDAMQPGPNQAPINVTWMEQATLPNLLVMLRQPGQSYHIFHFIGHGGFDPGANKGHLVLENEAGRGVLVDGERLSAILSDHAAMRLVVLNACEGARDSRLDPFAGVASTLVRQGMPAVVAMQFSISDLAAVCFAGEFYGAIAAGFPVDAAVSQARKAIYVMPNDVEWGTPVLHMRAPDGVLFSVDPSTSVAPTISIVSPWQRPILKKLRAWFRRRELLVAIAALSAIVMVASLWSLVLPYFEQKSPPLSGGDATNFNAAGLSATTQSDSESKPRGVGSGVLQLASAIASSSSLCCMPAMAIDGDTDTDWSTAAGETTQAWLKVRLGQPARLDRFGIISGLGGIIKDTRLEFSDGSHQEITLKSLDGWQFHDLDPVVSESIRIVVLSKYRYDEEWDSKFVTIVELELFGELVTTRISEADRVGQASWPTGAWEVSPAQSALRMVTLARLE